MRRLLETVRAGWRDGLRGIYLDRIEKIALFYIGAAEALVVTLFVLEGHWVFLVGALALGATFAPFLPRPLNPHTGGHYATS